MIEKEENIKTPEELGVKINPQHYDEIIKFEKDLRKGIDYYNNQGQKVLNESEGKDIVVAIGNTGAGKSTLLNLLIGNPLRANDSGYDLVDVNNTNSFKIGVGSTSETLIPKFAESKSILFFDLPGLGDTRGSGVAFLNAICIKNILIKAKSVRFLFVEGKASFENMRGESFKRLLNTTLNLLPHSSELKGSSMFIVTQSHTLNKNNLIENFIKKK